MVVFSFNASKLVTVWDAANSPTLKWYYSLLNNEEILDAAWISLKVAVINASGSVILGTLAGFGLARFAQFRGRFTLNAMTTAPLVMPEVITGLSLLLLFVAMEQAIGWPAGRGITTMTIGHMTFSMAYVTVVVQSRMATFDTALEEAAMDLGARPLKVFFVITLPIIFPAILSGLAARLHALMGRSGDLELHLRPGQQHAAHGGVLQGAARRESGDQRAGDAHHHRCYADDRGRELLDVACRQARKGRDVARAVGSGLSKRGPLDYRGAMKNTTFVNHPPAVDMPADNRPLVAPIYQIGQVLVRRCRRDAALSARRAVKATSIRAPRILP